jgi:hypothetical protein
LKAFVRGLSALEPNETQTEISGDGGKGIGFPSVQMTEPTRQRARAFLRGRLIQTQKQQIVVICCELARAWFKAYRRFLL